MRYGPGPQLWGLRFRPSIPSANTTSSFCRPRRLETWLKENGYRLPKGASSVLGSYVKQKMHFFVAKVNLQERSKLGYSSLRPIQVAYESPKFMLPLRLGTLNGDGYQELFIYTLTPKGRVEPTN